jgi:hypothetical protein
MYTTSLQEAGSTYPSEISVFTGAERPLVFVRGYGDETVTLKILRLATGKYIFSETVYIPSGKTWAAFPQEQLPPGSYMAHLFVGGTLTRTCSFTITE